MIVADACTHGRVDGIQPTSAVDMTRGGGKLRRIWTHVGASGSGLALCLGGCGNGFGRQYRTMRDALQHCTQRHRGERNHTQRRHHLTPFRRSKTDLHISIFGSVFTTLCGGRCEADGLRGNLKAWAVYIARSAFHVKQWPRSRPTTPLLFRAAAHPNQGSQKATRLTIFCFERDISAVVI